MASPILNLSKPQQAQKLIHSIANTTVEVGRVECIDYKEGIYAFHNEEVSANFRGTPTSNPNIFIWHNWL